MPKCIVCGNRSNITNVNREGVSYHGIPKNEYMRREWLKVLGIDRYREWQRICSDHFLEENYKPGKKRYLFSNAIPQPYNRNSFPSNYATQSNDVETGNNVILPMEQNITLKLDNYDESDNTESGFYREEHIENDALKNRSKPGAVPSLFLDNAPDSSPVSINEVPVLSTCEDQFISPIDNDAADQSLEEIQKNKTDNIIDYTSMKFEDFTRVVHGFIYEMSKEVVLPSIYWKCEHLYAQNATGFYQRDTSDVTVKKVIFYNNFVPTIQIYGKKYEHKMLITTTKELDNLLEKIDSIEKCYGRGGYVSDQCIGYCENSLDNMCSGCQELVKDRDLQRMRAKIETKNKAIESFINRIADKKKTVLELRKSMAEIKRNRQH